MSNSEAPGMRALWWEGIRCGLRNLLHLNDATTRRQALRLLLCPVDLWRYAEFDAVLSVWRGERPILDIGSPKLLALVLARRFGANVITGDIVQHIGTEIAVYARAADHGSLPPCVFDARALPFASESLPFVYSVSVLEHIGGDGDRESICEIARVLQAGGRAVVTLPIGTVFRDVWIKRDLYGSQPKDGQRVFFSYIYDLPTLDERLVKPSGLTLESMNLYSDDPPGWYESRYLPAVSSASLTAVLTKMRDLRLARRHIKPLANAEHCPGRGVAVLVLRK